MNGFKAAVGYTAGDTLATSKQESDALKAQMKYEKELLERGLNITTSISGRKAQAVGVAERADATEDTTISLP